VERVHLGAVVALGQGQVVEVEGVLGADVAAEQAVAAVGAGPLIRPADRAVAVDAGVDGDGHLLGRVPGPPGRLEEHRRALR
jgi:hypothetical protein